MKMENPVFHKFTVFSVINSDGNIIPSYAKCNNCDAIHKVLEVGKSRQLSKESSNFLPNLTELKHSIPENIKEILESYKVDITTWQEAQFIYQNEKWGKNIILFKEENDGKISGKFLLILGRTIFKIEQFTINEDDDE
jgi:hypothetical protein